MGLLCSSCTDSEDSRDDVMKFIQVGDMYCTPSPGCAKILAYETMNKLEELAVEPIKLLGE